MRRRVRSIDALAGPMIAFGMGLIVFLAALFYDRLPFHPPACTFRTALGIPCVGCGGTRAMLTLVAGHPWDAFRLNPAVIIAFFGSLLWPMIAFWHYLTGAAPSSPSIREHRIRRHLLIATILLLINWLYLIHTLP